MSYMRMTVFGLLALVIVDYLLLDSRIALEMRDALKAAGYEVERVVAEILP